MKQLALELTQKGIEQAVSNANRFSNDWSEKAFFMLTVYLIAHPLPFLCEDFRKWCGNKLPEPPSKRAYGGIIRRAKKDGLIKHVGYKAVSNPKAHLTPASVWLKI